MGIVLGTVQGLCDFLDWIELGLDWKRESDI